MKIQRNNRYFTIAVYAVGATLVAFVGILAMLRLNEVWKAICKLVYLVYELLKPLIIGFIIAYLLDPIVKFYESKCHQIKRKSVFHSKNKKKQMTSDLDHLKRWQIRTLPTFFTFLSLIVVLGLFILIIVMNVEAVSGNFSFLSIKESIRKYLAYFENVLDGVNRFTNEMGILKGQEDIVQKIYGVINAFVIRISNQLINYLTTIGLNAMNLLLAFVIAFYLLQDKERCVAVTKKISYTLLKPKIYRHVMVLCHDIDYIFSGYIRGQIIDAMIVAVLTSLALTIIQLDFAIIIGVIAGIFNLIPYFGPIVGLVLAIIIGVLDPNPMKALYGAGAILIIQQIDGWIIVPKIVGECVKLHPVIVLLAILIGGNLFGLIGMLIGVPIAAFIRLVLLRYVTELFPDGEEALKEEMVAQAKEEDKNN